MNKRYTVNVDLNDKASQVYNGEKPNLNGELGFGYIKDNNYNIILNIYLNDNSSKKSMPKAPKAYNDDYDPENYDPCFGDSQLIEYENASVVPSNYNNYPYYVSTNENSNYLVDFNAFISLKNGKVSMHTIHASTNITSIENAVSQAKQVKKLYYATRKAVRVFFNSKNFKNRKNNQKKNKLMIAKMRAQHAKNERIYHEKISKLRSYRYLE